jgi:hypothetical protein
VGVFAAGGGGAYVEVEEDLEGGPLDRVERSVVAVVVPCSKKICEMC